MQIGSQPDHHLPDLTHASSHFAFGFDPIARPDARILILGSLPGTASLTQQQYYAHRQNAFWRILEQLYQIPATDTYEARCQQVCAHQLAIWDVCHAAHRIGSLDSNIAHHSVIANDLNAFLSVHPRIELIAFNGQAAAQLFKKHIRLLREVETLVLPSTSPANASLSFAEKLARWAMIQSV